MNESLIDYQANEVFSKLEQYVYAALETYSNVHRGSGYNSIVTTQLYETARDNVLKYLDLDRNKYHVIFCTPRRAEVICKALDRDRFKIVSSRDFGFPVGIRAIAVKREAWPKDIPYMSGGGTARLVSPDWVIWSKTPERFEAGTPAIINIIAFARALILLKHSEQSSLRVQTNSKLNAEQILNNDELNGYTGIELLHKLRDTLIGLGMMVETTEGEKQYINFDNAASTRTFMPVWKTVRNTWQKSREVQQQLIGETRSIISDFVGAPLSDYEVIFTSNTTEAINLVAESLSLEATEGAVVINTILEHNSNELPWRSNKRISLIRINADKNGFIDLDELEKKLLEYNNGDRNGNRSIMIVAVTGASNVLGTFNDLELIASIVHKYGARLLVDAAQLVAHRKVEVEKCDIDYLVFSAHKVYAPFGTGVLIARKGLLRFSPEESACISNSGEENPGGIAGLGKALLLLERIGLDVIREEERELTEHALRNLSKIKGIKIFGISDPDLPEFNGKGGVISFTLKDKMSNKVARELSEKSGIGVRAGCHCSHLLVKYLVGVPPFLEQFQGFLLRLLPRLSLPGVVRISFGIENSTGEIERFVSELRNISQKH